MKAPPVHAQGRAIVELAMRPAEVCRDGTPYLDYGPPRVRHRGMVLLNSLYAARPFCELCGAFRGRLLRLQAVTGEYRCYGCDRERD